MAIIYTNIYKLAIVRLTDNHFWVLITTMAQIDIITKEDLDQFKQDLIREITSLIKPQTADVKPWLRSVEVRSLLKISPATLQNFRIKGTLSFTKVGGIFFYKYDDILRVLEKKKK